MKVLVLGFPRTGTQSIAAALEQLGCEKVYHMREVKQNNQQGAWNALLDAKFNENPQGKKVEKSQFDAIFKGYDATADFPAAIFYRELIAAYPSAHLILSLRDEDLWFKSMQATLIHAHRAHPGTEGMASLANRYHAYLWEDDFEKNGRQAYQRHNDGVYKAATEVGRTLLLYDVEQGWGPLAEVLAKEVPEGEFPRVDDWREYKEKVSGSGT